MYFSFKTVLGIWPPWLPVRITRWGLEKALAHFLSHEEGVGRTLTHTLSLGQQSLSTWLDFEGNGDDIEGGEWNGREVCEGGKDDEERRQRTLQAADGECAVVLHNKNCTLGLRPLTGTSQTPGTPWAVRATGDLLPYFVTGPQFLRLLQSRWRWNGCHTVRSDWVHVDEVALEAPEDGSCLPGSPPCDYRVGAFQSQPLGWVWPPAVCWPVPLTFPISLLQIFSSSTDSSPLTLSPFQAVTKAYWFPKLNISSVYSFWLIPTTIVFIILL